MTENNNHSINQESERLSEEEAQKQNLSSDWISGVDIEDFVEIVGDIFDKVGDLIGDIDLNI